ncbi:hypothetical protein D7B24_000462 [Verticillium nonalfalfae]|uniref:Uncharacterized protein n=1 Tax=Verticillium nonalfalfae TaxID=1051616 RepID=A0A3M9Y3K5_9PEZI|nr:uncharacterized protein D7B24_000462 [Verticillium nonalfalfae]RNJ54446.1 hypothetical protein D7B24_000462 [Verticillium nonalfalfae]
MPKTSSQDHPQQWGLEDYALFGLFDSTDKVEEKHKAVARFIAIRKFFEQEEYRLGRLSTNIFNKKRDTKVKLFTQNLAQLLSPDDDLLHPLLTKPENTIEKIVLALSALTEPHRVDLQIYGLVDFFFVWFNHHPTFKIPADGLNNYIELMDAACEIVRTDRSKALHDKMGSIAAYKNYKFKKDREAQEEKERPRKKPKHDHNETLFEYRAIEKPASLFLEPRSKPLILNEENLTPSIKHDLEQVPNVHPKSNVFLLGEPLLSRVHETLGGRSPLAQGLMASDISADDVTWYESRVRAAGNPQIGYEQ